MIDGDPIYLVFAWRPVPNDPGASRRFTWGQYDTLPAARGQCTKARKAGYTDAVVVQVTECAGVPDKLNEKESHS